jgi:hypothetical protein
VEALQRCAPEERIKEFIQQQKYFPFSVLFNGGKKLKEIEFRWAPQTYLERTIVGDLTAQLRDPKVEYRSKLPEDATFADALGLHVTSFGFTMTLGSGIRIGHGESWGEDWLNVFVGITASRPE